MVKSNRLKQTKHKRQTKRKMQTNRKMRRQIGGNETLKSYSDYSSILKQGTSKTKVFIPGYVEICDMIDTFSNSSENIKKLDDGIRVSNVYVYTTCINPDVNADNNIIVLRQKDSIFSKNTSITCEDTVFWNLASHNFKIFIEILQWNPFLNIPTHIQSTEQVMSSNQTPMYVTPSYRMDPKFTDTEWWAKQSWWTTGVRDTLGRLPAQEPAQPDSSLAASAPQAQVESAEMKVQRLEAEVQRLEAEVQRLQSEVTKLTETNQKFIEKGINQNIEIRRLKSQLGQ
jgi:hypothetical protein